MDVRDRRVLITGGASGIGLGLARALKERGARVAVCSRRAELLERARAEGLQAHACDVADARALEALIDALDADGGLDMLVSNAAVSAGPTFSVRALREGGAALASADVERELLTNAGAAIVGAQRFLTRRGARPGTLVFVGSPVVFAPAVAPLYAASKAAQHSWCVSLRHALRGSNVRVVEVFPPAVDTALNPLGGAKAAPDAVGEAIARGLARDRAVIDVGPVWIVRALARLSPALALRLIEKASHG